MFLTSRDHQIVRLVADFGYLKSGHIRALVFEESKSNTSADRRLKALTELRYLRRVEIRTIGGDKGGSGQYVYALAAQGKKLFSSDTYMTPRMLDDRHTIAIADAFIGVWSLKKGGRYQVARWQTEPSSWRTIAGAEIRPDLYIELDDHHARRTYSFWLEVDMGTEGKTALRDKLACYYHAWQHSRSSDMETFPAIVFLVPTEKRRNEIHKLIAEGSEDAQPLFDVRLSSAFPPASL